MNLYFINGVLDWTNETFHVVAAGVAFSRYAETRQGRYSDRQNRSMETEEWISYSANISDVRTPKFAFNYMYSVKCVDARMLWPIAPPPTRELHGWSGCR